jgi:hypothetical protein
MLIRSAALCFKSPRVEQYECEGSKVPTAELVEQETSAYCTYLITIICIGELGHDHHAHVMYTQLGILRQLRNGRGLDDGRAVVLTNYQVS